MATVEKHIDTDPATVWAILADGWTYSNWVVGATHMRAVDARWPQVDSVLHHQQGSWPLTLDDEAVVAESEPSRRLVLTARGRPLGQARIEMTLHPVGSGTRVVMTETPISGPGKWLHNRLLEALLVRRNREALARLAAMAERRTSPPDRT